MHNTYLLIDLCSIIAPLLLSFVPGIQFYKTWGALFPAIIISSIIFIVWDMYFTHLGVWGFNSYYITGAHIGNLPVEEVLFFVCIPYACVFTWFCVGMRIKRAPSVKTGHIITLVLILASVVIAALHYRQAYTVFCFTLLALLLIAAQYVLKISWLSRFYINYALLLIPFLIVNGLLTGTGLNNPVVWYNNAQTLGIRILTIPVEDIFYGMSLVLLNTMLYMYFNSKAAVKHFPSATTRG